MAHIMGLSLTMRVGEGGLDEGGFSSMRSSLINNSASSVGSLDLFSLSGSSRGLSCRGGNGGVRVNESTGSN